MLALESAACAAAIATFFLEAGDSKTGQEIRPSITTIVDLAEKRLQEMFDELDTHHRIMGRTQVVRFLDRHDRLKTQVEALRLACPNSLRIKKLWSTFFGSNRRRAVELLRQIDAQYQLVLSASNSARGAVIRENMLDGEFQIPALPSLLSHSYPPDGGNPDEPPCDPTPLQLSTPQSFLPPITAGGMPLQPVVTRVEFPASGAVLPRSAFIYG
ncbi:hypothetical protein BD779DRAFT_1469986 [Infundibulicybe gibba]|nr:hypothetical protein BD779DRAFT_1469986 [Infundibulicybe gibba]